MTFSTEYECSYEEGAGNILDFLKNGKECAIEYMDSDGESRILTNCIIREYNIEKHEIEVVSNGELLHSTIKHPEKITKK